MTIVIIPSFDCNFRCKYCYINNPTKLLKDKLDADFICSVFSQLKELLKVNHNKLTIIWHGGEPLIWGIDNYKQVFEFIEHELPDVIIRNSIQCNLSLINDDYIDLFKQYNIKLGFSLDGTKEINDTQRIFANGDGTFSTIMDKLELCRKRGLNVGCIAVCSRKHVGAIGDVYHFMNKMKLNFKLNPLFETGEAVNNNDEFGITAKEYADIMIELYDMMMVDPDNCIAEDNLLEMGSAIVSGVTEHCMFGYNCQDNFMAIVPSGDVMPCGRFSDNSFLHFSYGNLHKETLADIMTRKKQSETYKRAEYIAHSGCVHCKWYHICHGGCLHDGFLASGDFRHKTFLCNAYQRIFTHIEKRLRESGLDK